MKKLAMILAIAGIVLASSAAIQAQPSSDTPGAWRIYPDGTEEYFGNDRYAKTWGNPDVDHYTSIHGALGYSGRYLNSGPNNDDIAYWESYNPPPEGTIIELRGGTSDTGPVWEIGGDGAQGGVGREKQKSLVVQQNGITIRGQNYDPGDGSSVQQEIFFNNGATTALFYLEASDLTIENVHIRGTWPTNSGGYALAIGRYTMIGPDPNATRLTVTGNTFNNLRAMFDTSSPTDHPSWSAPVPLTSGTVVDNTVTDTYYNIFKKYGVTFADDNTITGNTFNHVGEGKSYPALEIVGNSGTTCIDNNTFNGWRAGQYAIEVTSPLDTPIGIGENNVFVDQVGGSGAIYELYELTSGGHAVGAPSESDITGCAPSVIEVTIDIKPGSDPNSINPKSKGKIPVAILSTSDFDAPNEVDWDSLTFGPTGDEDSLAFCSPSPEDVNYDGLDDLVCHFDTQSAEFGCGYERGYLKGQTGDDVPIEGSDSVRIVPCK
jgi:hypothetical protein